ncbi:hypothetical protein GCM10009575_058810 [Streptomyces rhizosphaericus]|uniref:Uncharacterized protein n=1 Tax=Streptomyces rhizosphaericus TaxID=114699 RepID=A0ABN1QGP1_9ACTN
MITAVALAGYAALVGAAMPPLLSRARWPHRAPAIAVLAWQGLMVTFVVAAALAVYHLVLTERHVHEGLLGLLSVCGLAGDAPVSESAPTLADALALSGPAVIVLLPLGWFALCTWRARRARQRHLDMLVLVGEPAPGYDATVVDHGAPAVYCLPGRRRRVVITRGPSTSCPIRRCVPYWNMSALTSTAGTTFSTCSWTRSPVPSPACRSPGTPRSRSRCW